MKISFFKAQWPGYCQVGINIDTKNCLRYFGVCLWGLMEGEVRFHFTIQDAVTNQIKAWR